MNKVALINGVTGQDGLYLTELLLSKRYKVIGIVRDIQSAKNKIPIKLYQNLELVCWDMRQQEDINKILSSYKIDEFYNLAAFSTGIGLFDNPVNLSDINGLAVGRILEAIRAVGNKIKFLQASSREVYGVPLEIPQSEKTLKNPINPYGAAKLYADNLVRIYREKYGIYACSAILFNHESPRRTTEYISRKITNAAAKIKLGLIDYVELGNIDAKRDWGFAGDTVMAMWLMLQQSDPEDFVVATGNTYSVRDLCQEAFEFLGLDYKKYVRINQSYVRPPEFIEFRGNANKAREQLGWAPKTSFKELIQMMVEHDLRVLEKNEFKL